MEHLGLVHAPPVFAEPLRCVGVDVGVGVGVVVGVTHCIVGAFIPVAYAFACMQEPWSEDPMDCPLRTQVRRKC